MAHLGGIPIRICDMLGDKPFCKLMPNFELTPAWEPRQIAGEQIICNPAGWELLKAEITRRNAATTDTPAHQAMATTTPVTSTRAAMAEPQSSAVVSPPQN